MFLLSPNDPNEEFMDLKNYEKNPYRMDIGYISNNSVFASLGMDYTDAAERARTNGEPGFAWLENMQAFCAEGYSAIQKYDDEFSKMYCIPISIKTTCIKPSGTVSLLAGATPGMHYPKSKYYIRRMRIATNSDLT
jgi:hypothetical protein